MNEQCIVITITNQKGGVGKTVTTMSLGVALRKQKQKVLLIDLDPQGHTTKGFGFKDRSGYDKSMKDILMDVVNEEIKKPSEYILHNKEGIDLVPANLSLSGIDMYLSNAMSRETLLKRFLDGCKPNYDYIIVDSSPALNLLTINALTASDSVIIPVQAEPYAVDGLDDLMMTIRNTQKHLNPNLKVDGILMTMYDTRTKLSEHIANEVSELYGKQCHIFNEFIPRNVAMAESPLAGESPFLHCPKADAVRAYKELAKEVLKIHGKTITKNHER